MKIEHIAIWVKDLEIMKQFYIQYFQATANEKYTNDKKGFSSYFLTFEECARLEIMHRVDITTTANENTFGFAHFAFSVGSPQKVDELTEVLRADGYEIKGEPRITGDGYYESVVTDPEGNLVEITQ